MPITKGQQYQINSFDLGFINVESIHMLVTVVCINDTGNGIVLEPGLFPGIHPNNGFFSILRWFQNEYPAIQPGELVINNRSAFEKLVELNIAVLHDERTCSPGADASR
jgi:hypothetical protein